MEVEYFHVIHCTLHKKFSAFLQARRHNNYRRGNLQFRFFFDENIQKLFVSYSFYFKYFKFSYDNLYFKNYQMMSFHLQAIFYLRVVNKTHQKNKPILNIFSSKRSLNSYLTFTPLAALKTKVHKIYQFNSTRGAACHPTKLSCKKLVIKISPIDLS